MPKKKQSTILEVYERALRDALSRNELRAEHFGWTIQGKYLPRWAAESGLSSEFTVEQITATLCLDAVQARMAKCKNMNEVTSIAGRVKGAESDLSNMIKVWDNIRANANEQSPSGKVPGEGSKVVRQARASSSSKPSVGRPASMAKGGA